jgi:tRNA(Arg) A34 adenosine deaminase TadA
VVREIFPRDSTATALKVISLDFTKGFCYFTPMHRKYEQLLEMATNVAIRRMSRIYSYQFGLAAIRRDGAIIRAYNEYSDVPMPPAHAEYRGSQKAGRNSVIAVVRLNNSHKWLLAKPCDRCKAFMQNNGIKRVLYSIDEGEYGVMDLS